MKRLFLEVRAQHLTVSDNKFLSLLQNSIAVFFLVLLHCNESHCFPLKVSGRLPAAFSDSFSVIGAGM